MRVLISGGGIAGLTLAYWLHQYNIQPVVIEQADDIRHDGYGIDFFGTGYDVAERMGLIDRLRSRQIPIDNIAYVNASGKPITKFPISLMQKIMYGKYMALMRWTVPEALYETIRDDVEVRFGCSLAAVQQSPDMVTVTFSDGTTEAFDLLIGADGIHSNTRTLVFGPEDAFGHFLGCVVASYPLPDRYGIGHTWQMYTDPGRLSGAYCSNHDGEIFTLLMYQTADKQRIPREQRLSRLRKVFAGMDWITQQLLEDVVDPATIFMDVVTQIQMPTWHRGRVALVGDACGCPTLISGQGASLAMGGAYLLAEALHTTSDYQDGFRQYEQQMLPHVQIQQKRARGSIKTLLPGSTWELQMQHVLIKLLFRDAFIGLLRQQFGADSLLRPSSQAR